MRESIFTGEYYNLKIIDLGDTIEIYKYERWIRKNQTKKSKFISYSDIGITIAEDEKIRIEKELREQEQDIQLLELIKEENKKRSLRRTKDRLIKLLEANKDEFETFITLTFKNDIDYKKAKGKLQYLLKKLKKDIKHFKYCWVLELTERGRPHFHLLTNYCTGCETSTKRKTKEQKEIEQLFCSNYWKNGFVTIQNIESKDRVIRYLTGYLTKDIEGIRKAETKGQRIYGYSRELNQPVRADFLVNESAEEILQDWLLGGELIKSSIYKLGEYNDSEVTFFKIKKGIVDV